MRRLLLLALLLVVAVVAGLTWAIKSLPWWGTVSLVLGLSVVGKLALGRLLTWALTIPFKWKGAVLRGATARVHSITPAMAAETGGQTDANSAAPADSGREHYQLDVTITPGPPTGKFTSWSPNELVLVKPESKLRIHGRDDDDDSCEIVRVEAHEDGQFKEDESASYCGPQRVRLRLAVRPGVQRLKFRYYFEEFGEVHLPAPGSLTESEWVGQNAA